MTINTDTVIAFDAIRNDKDWASMRIIIPKKDYLLTAEDDGYYYLQPVEKGNTTNATTT
jgi:hypothetical protein